LHDPVVVFAEPGFGADNVDVGDTAANTADVSRIERADASVELTGTTTPADRGTTGAGVVVAVVDSGYSPRTPTSQVRSGRTTVKRAAMAPTTTITGFARGAVHQQTNRC